MSRINHKFQSLKDDGKKAFVSYIMAGDLSLDFSYDLMNEMASNGVDVIELGMPFSDPMAEGPTIQKSAARALKNGTKIKNVIEVAKKFRANNSDTPVILMGYFNPIFYYGVAKFCKDCIDAGIDGLIIVDLPPEEENELTRYINKKDNLDLIKLTTPTTDLKRAEIVLKNSGGFVYYVSVAGVTGVKEANIAEVDSQITNLKTKTDLPICVGFGIKNADQAKKISSVADGIVIGSAFVKIIEENQENPKNAIALCNDLVKSVRLGLNC